LRIAHVWLLKIFSWLSTFGVHGAALTSGHWFDPVANDPKRDLEQTPRERFELASDQSPMVSLTGRGGYCHECREKKPCPAAERKGVRMMPDNVALFAAVILLLPMFYFLLAAPAFLLVRLDIPAVAQLLRAMFSGYFLTLAIAGGIGTAAVAAEGRPVLAIGIGLIAAFAASSRRWFLRHMDARLSDRDAGDADAVRRLRRLHWGGMASNAIQLAVIVACIPYAAVAPA
jgi:hypothetical protein